MARSLAKASSPIKEEAFTIAKGIPKPRTQREARNILTFVEPACNPAPRHKNREADKMVHRRPKYCDAVGMKGMAIRAPKEYIAFNRPSRASVGSPKSAHRSELV